MAARHSSSARSKPLFVNTEEKTATGAVFLRPPQRKDLPLPLGEVARRRRDGEGFLLPSQAEITDFGQLPQRGSQGTVQACTAPKPPPFTGEVAFAKQMTEGALRWHPLSVGCAASSPKGRAKRPLSHRLRGDSSPINGGAFGAVRICGACRIPYGRQILLFVAFMRRRKYNKMTIRKRGAPCLP